LHVYPEYIFFSLIQPHTRAHLINGQEIHCVVGKNYFVTVPKRDSKGAQDAYERVAQNASAWRLGASYFLYLAAQHVIDAYYPLLDRMSQALYRLEEDFMLNGTKDKLRKPIYAMKQQFIHIFSMVFLPLTFLTSLFELNFVSLSDPVVLPISGRVMFLGVLTLMVFSVAAIIYFFRRRGWI